MCVESTFPFDPLVPNVPYTPQEVVKCVPYQLCPKCNGHGNTVFQTIDKNITAPATITMTCDVCHGAKIIPMYVVPNYTVATATTSTELKLNG